MVDSHGKIKELDSCGQIKELVSLAFWKDWTDMETNILVLKTCGGETKHFLELQKI